MRSDLIACICSTYEEYVQMYDKYYKEEDDSNGNESTRKSKVRTCKDSKK